MATAEEVRIGVWNSEWASRRSPRGSRIAQRLVDLNADILCLTEGYRHLLPAQGSVIESQPDYGYPVVAGRRKVLVWSRKDWTGVDHSGSPKMPGGRFVSGVTKTRIGSLAVIGVCIPWRFAHVTTGHRNRKPWEDHLAYLGGLREVLLQHQGQPLLVAGDFNQSIPRRTQPRHVYQALQSALNGLVEIATAGHNAELDRELIDHVAHSSDLKTVSLTPISRVDANGSKLSDHHGVVVKLETVLSLRDARMNRLLKLDGPGKAS